MMLTLLALGGISLLLWVIIIILAILVLRAIF